MCYACEQDHKDCIEWAFWARDNGPRLLELLAEKQSVLNHPPMDFSEEQVLYRLEDEIAELTKECAWERGPMPKVPYDRIGKFCWDDPDGIPEVPDFDEVPF